MVPALAAAENSTNLEIPGEKAKAIALVVKKVRCKHTPFVITLEEKEDFFIVDVRYKTGILCTGPRYKVDKSGDRILQHTHWR